MRDYYQSSAKVHFVQTWGIEAAIGIVDYLKRSAAQAKVEAHTLWLAARDPRTPWPARLLAVTVVAYAFSPLDLIPDPIPVLGYLDDLVLLPLGVMLVRRVIPREVMEECREKARLAATERRSGGALGVGLVVGVWLLFAAIATWFAYRVWG